jgi:hypothetical protein
LGGINLLDVLPGHQLFQLDPTVIRIKAVTKRQMDI